MFTSGDVSTRIRVGLVGVNYKTSTVEFREKLALSKDKHQNLLKYISTKEVGEIAIVSTCNRVEFIFTYRGDIKDETIFQEVLEKVARFFKIDLVEVKKASYFCSQVEAVKHIFAVTAGLDSMVLGETQIFGQVKRSFNVAKEAGFIGPVLNRLFNKSFRASKSVRTKTGIGKGAISISSAARVLAQQIFGALSDAKVMLVGAGEMGELVLRHFQASGVQEFMIVNRSEVRGRELAEIVGGITLGFNSIEQYLSDADIVIGTSGKESDSNYFIDKQMVQTMLNHRRGVPQFYIDLGVPRNFEPDIEQLSDAFLYNIDDLEVVVERNRRERRAELDQANILVEDEAKKYLRWLLFEELSPSLCRLNEVDVFQNKEVREVMKKLRQENISKEKYSELCSSLEVLIEKDLASSRSVQDYFLEVVTKSL